MSVNPKYFYFWTFVWIAATLICWVVEGTYGNSATLDTINSMTKFSVASEQTPIGPQDYIILGKELITNVLPTMLLWNYSFIADATIAGSSFSLLQILLIATLDPGLIITLALLFKQLISIFH